MAARSPAGAKELVIRIVHLIDAEHGPEAALVKGAVVCHEGQSGDERLDLSPHDGEYGRVVGVLMRESVHLLTEPGVVVGFGMDERIERVGDDTDTAPVFPEVWKQIEPLIEGLPLVAHNKPFDEGCLKAVFRVYQMDYPDYEFYDTLCVSRRVLPELDNHQLHTVAAACGYQLENHHHALADAEACAWIAREIL